MRGLHLNKIYYRDLKKYLEINVDNTEANFNKNYTYNSKLKKYVPRNEIKI